VQLGRVAKQRFASNESCPEDRVIAKRRDDLHASDEFRCERPPVDVWLDPERRRMWKAGQRRERELLDDGILGDTSRRRSRSRALSTTCAYATVRRHLGAVRRLFRRQLLR
jgi:hypothetical protein